MIYLSETLTLTINQPVFAIKTYCARDLREGAQAFAVRATKEWNKISVDIKQSNSVKKLKRPLFKIIRDNQILSKLVL